MKKSISMIHKAIAYLVGSRFLFSLTSKIRASSTGADFTNKLFRNSDSSDKKTDNSKIVAYNILESESVERHPKRLSIVL